MGRRLDPDNRWKRLLWTLVGSLVLHGLLGGWLWRTPAPPPLLPTRTEPLWVEFIEPVPPAVIPPPVSSSAAPVPPRAVPRPPRARTPASTPGSSRAPPDSPPESTPEAPSDTPRAVRLFPGPAGLPMDLGDLTAKESPGSSGRTWRAGEGPTSEQRIEEERARVAGRVQGFMEDDLAVGRVENGLVDPYFREMDQVLEKGLTGAPLFDYQGVLRYFGPSGPSRDALMQLQRYGATGSPDDALGGPSGTDRLEDVARAGTAGARARSRPRDPLGDMERQVAGANTLVVELELEQSPTGRLLGVKLVRDSGNPLFDGYVLEKIPPSLASLGPASEHFAARTRAPTVRSVWRVSGRVSFSRTIKLSKLHTL
ncbi:MAG: hypothetical protein ABW123_16135, partial [Cystobacter sp.]